MTADELLAELECKNVTVVLEGDGLRYRAPRGVLNTELRTAIAASRSAIVDRLRSATTMLGGHRHCITCDYPDWVDDPPADGRIRTTCGKCGRFIGYRSLVL
jgi:hypothetical protein